MPDENNPTIYIEYSDEAFPPVNWESLKTYALSFNVKNSGILKTPEATIVLKNTGGRYTGNGALTLEPHKFIRIRADVRDVIDTLFYGRIASLQSSSKKKKAEKLTITIRGMTQKLLQDTIDKKYSDEQNTGAFKDLPNGYDEWTMKAIIEHMLANPDSKEATGITLHTDTGDITTVTAKRNPERKTLLDTIKQICGYIGYTGYEEISGSNINLHLYPYGWQPTNPAITIPIDEEDRKNILEREFSQSLDEVYNHVCVWVSPTIHFPDRDRITENGVAKGYWKSNQEETTVIDETINRINKNCVKITNVGSGHNDTILDLTKLFPEGLDLKDKQITSMVFDYYCYRPDINQADGQLNVTLYDTNDNFITCACTDHSWRCDEEFWIGEPKPEILSLVNVHLSKETGMTEETLFFGAGSAKWRIPSGSTFNWILKKVRFRHTFGFFTGETITKVDGFHFEGGIQGNPIKDTALSAIDQDSINAYGRRVLHHQEPEQHDYVLIHELAEKILETTKNPLIKLKLKYGAKTWIKPNQTLIVNMPVYAISNRTYRIMEFQHEWSTKTKLLRTTFGLTPQFLDEEETIVNPVVSENWYASVIEGILKSMLW